MGGGKAFGQVAAVILVIGVAVLGLLGPAEAPPAETGLEEIEDVLRQAKERFR